MAIRWPCAAPLGMRHASAFVCVTMVAGSDVTGGFKDRNIVTKFEHKEALCNKL